MGHFAEINNEGVVLQVIVAEQQFIDSGAVGDPANWVQTSYNTHGGKHKDEKSGKQPLRKNYAGIGHIYDKKRDAFIPPKEFKSWILNEETCLWEAPVPMPNDGKMYQWDEDTLSWNQLGNI